MELWIRSQDKEILCKCDDIAYKEAHRGNGLEHSIVGYFNKNDDYEPLGYYKSKERALEVLDEIQIKIAQNYAMETFSNQLLIKGKEDEVGKLFKNMIHEMPKE